MFCNAETARRNAAHCASVMERRRAALDEDLASGVRAEVLAVSRELLAQAEADLAYWTAYGANVFGAAA